MRPTFRDLKAHGYFSGVDFGQVFREPRPEIPKESSEKVIFSSPVEKRMFFGNFKPRLLVLFRRNSQLWLAYKYLQSSITKREVSLSAKDFAEKLSQDDFVVKCLDVKYFFKAPDMAAIWCEEINESIRQHFNL